MKATIIGPAVARRDAVGNYVVAQARWLMRLGFDVRVIAQDAADVPIDLVPFAATVASPEALARSAAASAHLRASAVAIFHYPIYYALVEAIREPVAGKRVFHYHGVTPPALWSGPGREVLVRGRERLRLAASAELAIAHSEFTRDELAAGAAMPRERIALLGYPVPIERFSSDDAARAGGPPRLLYVGRMAPNKRIDVLVEALAELRRLGDRPELVLAGDGETISYRRHLEAALARARALGVAEAVRYLGPVPDADLPALFAGARAYVTASEHEGFCVPAVEAMAASLPVVATRAGALPETLGGAGIVVPPRDARALAEALHRVLHDAALREGMVERGRARARDFAFDRQEEAFRAVLAGAGIDLGARGPVAISLGAVEPARIGGPPLGEARAVVRVRNAGREEVPAGIALSAAWRGPGGEPLADAGTGALRAALGPGAEDRVELPLVLPARPGEYRLVVTARGGDAASAREVPVVVEAREPGEADERAREIDILARALRELPAYRDFTYGGRLLRFLARFRAAITRHLVRNHVDVIARRHAEAQLALLEQVRFLRDALQAERAARAAEVAELRACIGRLERRIGASSCAPSGEERDRS